MFTISVLSLVAFGSTVIGCTAPSSSSREVPSWLSRDACLVSPQVWEARPSPGKGIGVYATTSLEAGDIILSEPPMIRLTPPEFRDGVAYPLNDIYTMLQSSFDALSPTDKTEVLALHAHTVPADKDELMPIFRSNAYSIDNSIGLFPKGARINHSCRPNSSHYWNERLNRRIVYANRRIEEGEEIFASYIPLLYGREARQRRLDQYGFKCTCEACAQDETAQQHSDRRRQDIQKAFAAFESHHSLSVPKSVAGKKKAEKNAKASIDLANLVEAEGLADYYVKAYHVAAVSHARIEKWKPATLWANKGYETSLMADSKSATTMELQALTSRFISNWNDELRNMAMR